MSEHDLAAGAEISYPRDEDVDGQNMIFIVPRGTDRGNANVRLERQPGTAVVHNTGHGGSGFTFSWGCA